MGEREEDKPSTTRSTIMGEREEDKPKLIFTESPMAVVGGFGLHLG